MSVLSYTELSDLNKIAIKAATEAGQYIQSQFDGQYVKQRKEGGDSLASQVVTEVDLKAQEIILKHLKKSIQLHDFGLLTEESADDRSRLIKDYFWCIDPMDGTLAFTEHRPGYAVSIALISKSGDPLVGVVYVPDEVLCYSATKGLGIKLNDLPFLRKEIQDDETLHVYMDRSFKSEEYFDSVKFRFTQWMEQQNQNIQFHADFGGVRNAIGVMTSGQGCYFKFPKKRKGCGSIWDYAATRLFLEELGLHVSNAQGDRLHLNDPKTTFMNSQGILYATDEKLKEFILELGKG
ncbi:MAG: inositol monophosphatase family protein [Bacteroidota bacterium]